MLVSSFNLCQSFNYAPYLFFKKLQIRDQLFLYRLCEKLKKFKILDLCDLRFIEALQNLKMSVTFLFLKIFT